MELRIDTSKDSKEEIRKAIEFLKKFIDVQDEAKGFDVPSQATAAIGAIGMFSDSPQVEPAAKSEKKSRINTDEDGYTIIPY